LIEIMVALLIGLVLVGGAMQVYLSSRATYAINENAARLQETARYALSVLEPDVRMAGYWGLAREYQSIADWVGQPTIAVPAPLPKISEECGYNFIVDLSRPVEGQNNMFGFGQAPITNCDAFNSNPRPSADTLTVRHASLALGPVPTGANQRLQICSSRGIGSSLSTLLGACAVPSERRDMIVRGYYVSNDATANSGGAGMPALRVKSLIEGATPVFDDNEVIEGVEDLQIQLGMEPYVAVAGVTATQPKPYCGMARFYLNPGDALPAGVTEAQIVSVRIWLLIRADAQETGFIDNRTYVYADRAANSLTSDLTAADSDGKGYQPGGNAQMAPFRRLLVSRTFQIRNVPAADSVATSAAAPCP
jgi:type IV pilus assembly protein PilW